jgi:hypothetical protein
MITFACRFCLWSVKAKSNCLRVLWKRSDRNSPKKDKPKEEQTKNMKLTNIVAGITLTLTATTSLVLGQERQNSTDSQGKPPIVGTWLVTRHGVDCNTGEQIGPDFPAMMTFNQGGTLNAYAIPPNGSTPANSSPEYGYWVKQHGSQTYTVRDVSFGYNTDGTFAGSANITANVTLGSGGQSLSYSATIDFLDADGNLQFSICGAATGTRFQ